MTSLTASNAQLEKKCTPFSFAVLTFALWMLSFVRPLQNLKQKGHNAY